jgi:hypothetical protein
MVTICKCWPILARFYDDFLDLCGSSIEDIQQDFLVSFALHLCGSSVIFLVKA